MKRLLLGMLVQIVSGVLLHELGLNDIMTGTISCSLNWIVCCHDAKVNFKIFPKNETDV